MGLGFGFGFDSGRLLRPGQLMLYLAVFEVEQGSTLRLQYLTVLVLDSLVACL